MKQHKVVNTKLVPLVHTKNNVDEDTFLVVPKSSVPRGKFIVDEYIYFKNIDLFTDFQSEVLQILASPLVLLVKCKRRGNQTLSYT